MQCACAEWYTLTAYVRLCPCITQYTRWDSFGVRAGGGFIESDKAFFSWLRRNSYFITTVFSFYRVHLTVVWIRWHVCESLITSAPEQTPIVLSMLNCTPTLVRTTHYGTHLTYELGLFLPISERPFTVKVLTWKRASNTRWSVWELLLLAGAQGLLASGDWPTTLCTLWLATSCCPCILVISQLDCYFLCWLLARYSKLTRSGAMTFLSSVKVSWMDLCCQCYDGWKGRQMRPLQFVVTGMYTDSCKPALSGG